MTNTTAPSNGTGTVGLSAPWYTVQRTVSFTIGQSAQIMVSQLVEQPSGEYVLTITSQMSTTAQALANTVKSEFALGNITVKVVFQDSSGTTFEPETGISIDQRVVFLKEALVNNPAVFSVGIFNEKAAVSCMPIVVQFYNDDLSNPNQFTSMKCSDAFQNVMMEEIICYTQAPQIGNF
ncbi:MAG: hypothetical protein AAFV95_09255 [Bacteroidota bacterium]